MDVTDLEPRALPAQTSRPQGREPALVGDLRQRIGLVHELRELAASEKFANRRHHGFRIDQVVRHGRGHFLVDRHFFLDRAFHPHQTDPELILEELPDGPHAAIAQMIDVVHGADVLGKLQRILDDLVEVLRLKRAMFQRRVEAELYVELQPSHLGKIVLARVIEHPLEESRRRLNGGRVPRTLLSIDLDKRFLT